MSDPSPALSDETPAELPCPICGTARAVFADLSGRPKAKCPKCGSTERHRAFATAYRQSFGDMAGFAGKRVLAIRPDDADKAVARAFGAREIVTYDAFPRSSPDIVSDPARIELADATFDVVLSNAFLASVPDPAAAIAEIRRILKPDGVALIYESAAVGKPTTEVADRARQASWYGEAVLDRYGIGLLREWGFEDLEARLSETFGLGLFQTTDPGSGRDFLWFFAANSAMTGGPFLTADERAALLGAHGSSELRGAPPYTCPLCQTVFEETVGKEDCPHCHAPSRARSLVDIVHNELPGLVDPDLAARLPLLAFAMTGDERRLLSPLFPRIQPVSLFGDYGADNIKDVDARDLSRFADGSFSATFGVGLYDYFPQHDQALAEAFRVTAPGGAFIQLILPPRLRGGMQPPVTEHVIERSGDYYDYLPDGAKLYSIVVGRQWFVAAMQRAGFQARMVTLTDPATGIVNTWFLGRKPA